MSKYDVLLGWLIIATVAGFIAHGERPKPARESISPYQVGNVHVSLTETVQYVFHSAYTRNIKIDFDFYEPGFYVVTAWFDQKTKAFTFECGSPTTRTVYPIGRIVKIDIAHIDNFVATNNSKELSYEGQPDIFFPKTTSLNYAVPILVANYQRISDET